MKSPLRILHLEDNPADALLVRDQFASDELAAELRNVSRREEFMQALEEGSWDLVLADYRLPVEPSLKILEGIHQHWAAILESFTEDEWSRTFTHPASGETINLKKALGLYAWHSKHHLAHVTETIKKF